MNLPRKSHPCKIPEKRRLIEKVCDIATKEKKTSISTINSILNFWQTLQPNGWRCHQISEDAVHLTYYKNYFLHSTPDVSFLITEKDERLQLCVAFAGEYATQLSATLEFGTKSLEDMLQYLVCMKVCEGYESVPNKAGWIEKKAPHMNDGRFGYTRR